MHQFSMHPCTSSAWLCEIADGQAVGGTTLSRGGGAVPAGPNDNGAHAGRAAAGPQMQGTQLADLKLQSAM